MTTGRCLCGAIRYEYYGEPTLITHCHCESCRRQTSSPMTTFIIVPKAALRFTPGKAKGICLLAGRGTQLLRRVRFADLLSGRGSTERHRPVRLHAG